MWWHSAATSERGFWIILEKMKTLWGYNWARLDICEVNDWLVKKMCEDNLRLHLSEVLIIKTRRHSENTTWRGFLSVSEKTILNTFWVYIWARCLNFTEKYWSHSETTTRQDFWFVSEKTCVKTFWGYKKAKILIG